MERVIARAASGDADALAELWRGHQHLLLRYFRGKGMRDPDDLASIVWIEVARGLPSFTGDGDDFRRWLFTIAARRRVDEIRRDHLRRRRHDAIAATLPDQSNAGADDDYERAAALDRALAIVRTLPHAQAEAVLLRVVVDLSVTDVAAIMGQPEGNIRVLVHRGLKRLSESTASTSPEPTKADDRVTDRRARSMYAV